MLLLSTKNSIKINNDISTFDPNVNLASHKNHILVPKNGKIRVWENWLYPVFSAALFSKTSFIIIYHGNIALNIFVKQ